MKIYISILVATLLFTSCSDFLDREPNDSLFPGIFWETEKDARLALTACYRDFDGSSILYRDCASDNAFNYHRHEGWQPIGDGTMSPGAPGSSMFSYTTIRKCNEFLENVESVAFKSDEIKKAFIGEVRFIRAYRYFIMTQYYGDVPLVTKTYTNPKDAEVPRDPRADVENFIITELNDIGDNFLAEKHPSDRARIKRSAAYALLSRLYLYKGMYAEAVKASEKVKGHDLFPSYEGLFLMENEQNDEVILDYEYIEGNLALDLTPFLPNSRGGWSSVVPLQSLVDNYEMLSGLTIAEGKVTGEYDETNPYVNRDPRLRATILYPGQFWEGEIFTSVEDNDNDNPLKADNATKSGYNFKKYFNNLSQYPQGFWETGRNMTLIRYAEVLLNFAEAKIELNEIDGNMYDAIDKVRKRAGLPIVDRSKYANKEKLRALVRRERRSEFAFEGLRRFDIIRWGIAEDVMKGTAYGCNKGSIVSGEVYPNGDVKVNLNGKAYEVDKRLFSSANLLLPIPQTSIDKNKKLLPNNPGYN